MRRIMVAALRADGAFAMAVDNEACCPGTADVYTARIPMIALSEYRPARQSWTELKRIDKLPARPETPVRVPCFKPHQRIWHRDAHAADVVTWVLLLVDDEWLLFNGWWAADHLGNVPIAELRKAAVCRWLGGFNLEHLTPWL
jgi:hypothetical protein